MKISKILIVAALTFVLGGCAAFGKSPIVESTITQTTSDGTVTVTESKIPAALIATREQQSHAREMVDGACKDMKMPEMLIEEGTKDAAWASAFHSSNAAWAMAACARSKAEIARANGVDSYARVELERHKVNVAAQRSYATLAITAACLGNLFGFCDTSDTGAISGDIYNTYVGNTNTRSTTSSSVGGRTSGVNLFSDLGSGGSNPPQGSSSNTTSTLSSSGDNGDQTLTQSDMSITVGPATNYYKSSDLAHGSNAVQGIDFNDSSDFNNVGSGTLACEIPNNAACFQH